MRQPTEPAEVLFDVITDPTSYPNFDPALIKVEVVAKDQSGGEFLADRKTKIGEQARIRSPRAQRDVRGGVSVQGLPRGDPHGARPR